MCRKILAFFSILALSSCVSLASRIQTAKNIALSAGFEKGLFASSNFNIAKFSRVTNNGAANIYIEGDGLAWISRTRPSLNPTPVNPIALKLAAIDDSENVIYLARPCQYVDLQADNCNVEYWTNKRFAPEVIDSYMQLLDDLEAEKMNLIGFSGGAGIAAILAAKRDDVLSLTTIAGNLDTEKFTQIHHVSPMNGSLNPADFAHLLGAIEQKHYVGGDDKIISKEIYESFSKKLPPNHDSNVIIIPNASHESGWGV